MKFNNIKINNNDINQRLDNFIIKNTQNLPIKHIHKKIRKKYILINKKKTS